MRIEIVPCLRDNYAYLLSASRSAQALVVDPSEAQPIEAALRERKLELVAILNTHHHYDHVGGNAELVRRHPGLRVYGHSSDRGRIPEQTHFVDHGDSFDIAGLLFSVMHIPGHTSGAIAYSCEDAVFTGDTLFAAGCGRLFEGTPQDMFESLNEKLALLPDETRVFCGHEYTATNLRFAATLEPSNAAISEKAKRVAELRALGRPTVPSTLADERATNPFMRTGSAELIESLGLRAPVDPVAVLAATRKAKDDF